jgi:hypothetical protein
MFDDVSEILGFYDIAAHDRPEYEYPIEMRGAERIMQSESTHVRTDCAKHRKKNARVRPTGNIARSRRRRTRTSE